MNGSCALTTFDNPYDPFERFSDWFLFDVGKGYNTCSYLARIAKTSEQFSDEENEQEIELTIDEIIKHDFIICSFIFFIILFISYLLRSFCYSTNVSAIIVAFSSIEL